MQAHTAVGGLRQELLPEISKKIDERKVEDEFTKAHSEVGETGLSIELPPFRRSLMKHPPP